MNRRKKEKKNSTPKQNATETFCTSETYGVSNSIEAKNRELPLQNRFNSRISYTVCWCFTLLLKCIQIGAEKWREKEEEKKTPSNRHNQSIANKSFTLNEWV